MTKLNEFKPDDQLYYIRNFINYCNEICDKLSDNSADKKKTVSAESLLLNQLIKD